MEMGTFWEKADQEIAEFDLLKHPFYQAWSAGELTREDLKFYAEQYYHHVSQFPAYLTALHSRLPESAMRRAVLANAYEEECGSGADHADSHCSHAELWQRFAQGMGSEVSSREETAPIAEIADLLKTFRVLAQAAPVATVFGALFAYESQVPGIAAGKLSGLKKHYGADDRTCSYFSLHQTADVYHSNVWRKIISDLIERDPRNASEALEGISCAARALWTALDGIDRARPNRVAQASACGFASKA